MNARRRPVEGWLTHPRLQDHPSEGHTNAVTVLRMVGTRHQHHAVEPIPFRSQPAPLRSIKPPRAAHGLPGGNSCAVRPADEPSPLERVPRKSSGLLYRLTAASVFGLMAAAMAFMGPPQDH